MMYRKRNICLLQLLLLLCFFLAGCEDYDTNDLSEYGWIHGNPSKRSDRMAQEDFDRYFPAEIDPSWEDVHYHYHAYDSAVTYEINLEFVIPNQAQFDRYVSSIAPLDQFSEFPYDTSFLEYDHTEKKFELDQVNDTVCCDFAKIKVTLINLEEHRVIITVIYVNDAAALLEEIDWLFNRFDIDPFVFEQDCIRNTEVGSMP